jgi:threonine/homoserine/homoserine lactone efflux protein
MGITLGLSAGISPGPLMTLVIAQTLRHNAREGLCVSVAPLITDPPIVVLSLFILGQLTNLNLALGLIGMIGGLYVLYLAYETTLTMHATSDIAAYQPRSFQKGIMINVLRPHPYLFWATVGAPLTLRMYEANPLSPFIFVRSFYVILVGSKMGIGLLRAQFRGFLNGRLYVNLMRILGILLALLAAFLIWDSLVLFGAFTSTNG